MKKGTILPLVLCLSVFIFIHTVSAQEFIRCQNISRGTPRKLKHFNDQLMYFGIDSLIIGSKEGFDCESNMIIETSNVKLRDFYPLSDDEFLINDNYKSLVKYDLKTKTIKKVLLTDIDAGLLDIFRNKESTYVGSYGKYYVNHDNLVTDVWQEITLYDDTYVVDINFVTDDFFLLSLGIDNANSDQRGGVALTQDGGKTWRIDTLGFDQRIYDIEYLGGGHIIAVGNEGDIFVSNDLGVSWTKKLNYPNINFLLKSEKIGQDVYVAGGEVAGNSADAYVFKSTDYGATWSVAFRMDSIGLAFYMTKDKQNRLYFSTSDPSIFYTKESVSSVVSIPIGRLDIKPNPTSSSFRIGSIAHSESYDIIIKSIDGTTLMTISRVSPHDAIDISHLPHGMYLLHCIDDKGGHFAQKVMKVD